jgi:replication factor C subunit 2/4
MDIDKENQTTSSQNTKKNPSGYQSPFIEKYRPQTLDDVVGNEETVLRLQAIAVDGNLPNLILSGPPGTGKVSL